MRVKLKELRALKGWTQAETAKRTDISLDYIRSLEIGRALPSLKMAYRLKKVFECKYIDDLIDEAM